MVTWNLGADPEAFLVHPATGKPIPAHKLRIPPRDKAIARSRGLIFRDGYAVELNPRHTHCREVLVANVCILLEVLNRRVGKRANVVWTPTVAIDIERDLRRAPSDVLVAGCDPAYNAYTEDLGKVSPDMATYRWRHGGGHMHISPGTYAPPDVSSRVPKTFGNIEWCSEAVRQLDKYLGVALTYLAASPGTFARRRYYGRAGDFRMQRYDNAMGLEYRTPGPEVWRNTYIASFAFGLFRAVIDAHWRNRLRPVSPTMQKRIATAINTGEGLRGLLHNFQPFFTTSDLITHQDQLRAHEPLHHFNQGWRVLRGGDED